MDGGEQRSNAPRCLEETRGGSDPLLSLPLTDGRIECKHPHTITRSDKAPVKAVRETAEG